MGVGGVGLRILPLEIKRLLLWKTEERISESKRTERNVLEKRYHFESLTPEAQAQPVTEEKSKQGAQKKAHTLSGSPAMPWSQWDLLCATPTSVSLGLQDRGRKLGGNPGLGSKPSQPLKLFLA